MRRLSCPCCVLLCRLASELRVRAGCESGGKRLVSRFQSPDTEQPKRTRPLNIWVAQARLTMTSSECTARANLFAQTASSICLRTCSAFRLASSRCVSRRRAASHGNICWQGFPNVVSGTISPAITMSCLDLSPEVAVPPKEAPLGRLLAREAFGTPGSGLAE